MIYWLCFLMVLGSIDFCAPPEQSFTLAFIVFCLSCTDIFLTKSCGHFRPKMFLYHDVTRFIWQPLWSRGFKHQCTRHIVESQGWKWKIICSLLPIQVKLHTLFSMCHWSCCQSHLTVCRYHILLGRYICEVEKTLYVFPYILLPAESIWSSLPESESLSAVNSVTPV